MNILGVFGRNDVEECHDASAAIVRDGRVVVALEQERVSRRKHAPGDSAATAARVCLEAAGLDLGEIDAIAYGWLEALGAPIGSIGRDIQLSRELTSAILPGLGDAARLPPIHFVRHHLSHMGASYYVSGFPETAGMIVDGQGESESISIFAARAGSIERLAVYPIEASLGLMYEAAAFYAGLGWNAAGKLMGLAAYGSNRSPIELTFDPTRGVQLPTGLRGLIGPGSNASDIVHAWLRFFTEWCYPFRAGDGTDVMYYADFAASVQHVVEQIGCALAAHAHRLTGLPRLVLGGGVGLNCGMNRAILDSGVFREVFAFPAPYDAGTSVGAALTLAHLLGDAPDSAQQGAHARVDLGIQFGGERVRAAIDAARLCADGPLTDAEIAERTAQALADQDIVVWFAGRDEIGPRALGRRSLLGHPGSRDTLDRLNRVKGRAYWRPVAPSVLAEAAAEVFEPRPDAALARFMLTVATVRSEYRRRIPAVVHVDHTARPHVVHRDELPLLWETLTRFRDKTGLPLVCNTSLNVGSEPIVHTPEEAVRIVTESADIGALAAPPYFVRRPH